MQEQITYVAAHERILDVIVQMQTRLDRYKEKDGHNPSWAKDRQDMIAEIAEFVASSNRTIAELKAESSDAYQRGYDAHKNSKQEDRHLYRQRISLFDALSALTFSPQTIQRLTKRLKGKEFLRASQKEVSKLKWPELYAPYYDTNQSSINEK